METASQLISALARHWPWFWPLWAAVMGGVAGSAIGCLHHRLRRGQSLRHPPSSCVACGRVLALPDLIPVASWLWLRGRCRGCGTWFGWGCLVWEAGLAASAAALAFWLQPWAGAPVAVLLVLVGVGLLTAAMHKGHTPARKSSS